MSTDQESPAAATTKVDREELMAAFAAQQEEALFSQIYGIACALASNNIVFDSCKRDAMDRYKKEEPSAGKPSTQLELRLAGYELSLRAMAVNDGIVQGIQGALEIYRRKTAEKKIITPAEKKLIVPG